MFFMKPVSQKLIQYSKFKIFHHIVFIPPTNHTSVFAKQNQDVNNVSCGSIDKATNFGF